MKNAEKTSLDDELKDKDKAFVLFYATWCPFSIDFLPAFKEYAKTNPNECMSVIIDDRADLCEKYAIKNYPTVLLFKKGKVSKRLDSEHGVGLSKKQLEEFTKEM
jgi:thiol-disulfide isomerase/thioredoxin